MLCFCLHLLAEHGSSVGYDNLQFHPVTKLSLTGHGVSFYLQMDGCI
jgi:hypothetical protein